MTTPAHAEPFGARLPTSDESGAADQLRSIIASTVSEETSLKLMDAEGKPCEVVLTPGLSGILLDMLRHIAKGESVTLVPVGEMLTTQQAADILNVSRPFLIGLLDKREIDHVMTGRHRRIRATDLFAYKAARDGRREDALKDLANIDNDLI